MSQFNYMCGRLRTRYRLPHGGNTGSSPVGSAKDFKRLAHLFPAGSWVPPSPKRGECHAPRTPVSGVMQN